MDSKTLRAIIVENREKGMTFQEIADMLGSKYGKTTSRQAVQGIYTRAKREIETAKDKETTILETDVDNIYCRGYNMSETLSIVNKMGHNVTYSKVMNIIKNTETHINEIRAYLIYRVGNLLDEYNDINQLYEFVEYKGYSITEKQLKQYIGAAHEKKILKAVKEILAMEFQIVDDRAIIKQTIKNVSDSIGNISVASLL